jgi:hypothetical protein
MFENIKNDLRAYGGDWSAPPGFGGRAGLIQGAGGVGQWVEVILHNPHGLGIGRPIARDTSGAVAFVGYRWSVDEHPPKWAHYETATAQTPHTIRMTPINFTAEMNSPKTNLPATTVMTIPSATKG